MKPSDSTLFRTEGGSRISYMRVTENDRRNTALNRTVYCGSLSVCFVVVCSCSLYKCTLYFIYVMLFTAALSKLQNNRVNYLHNLIKLFVATGGYLFIYLFNSDLML